MDTVRDFHATTYMVKTIQTQNIQLFSREQRALHPAGAASECYTTPGDQYGEGGRRTARWERRFMKPARGPGSRRQVVAKRSVMAISETRKERELGWAAAAGSRPDKAALGGAVRSAPGVGCAGRRQALGSFGV